MYNNEKVKLELRRGYYEDDSYRCLNEILKIIQDKLNELDLKVDELQQNITGGRIKEDA